MSIVITSTDTRSAGGFHVAHECEVECIENNEKHMSVAKLRW
jgi:hypothetical protein